MKIVGLLTMLLGWAIAIGSIEASGGMQLLLALGGFALAAIAGISLINTAHLKHPIWKE